MMRRRYLFCLSILLLFVCCETSAQKQVDIDTLTNRYLAQYLTGKIDKILLQNSLTSILPDGSWSDVNYDTVTYRFPADLHLNRLIGMTLAYCMDKDYKESQDLLKKIRLSINFFLSKNPKSSNWWYKDIGVPQKIMVVLLLLKNKIDREELLRYSSFLQDATGNKAHKAKNRTWVSAITINKGCIEDNYELIEIGFNSIASTIKIVPEQGDEGIKIDCSIHQHCSQINSGSYGMSFVSDLVDYILLSKGTSFEKLFTDEKRELVSNIMLQGQRLLGYRKLIDFGTVGRNLSRPEGTSNISPNLLDRMIEIDQANAEQYKLWKSHVIDNAPFPAIGNKYFWKSNIMTHHGANYYLSVKINSKRNNGTEMINRENLKGYYLPLGATNIMTRGEEYRNIFPVWDWTKIPGTTASQNPDSIFLRGYHYGSNDFGGGLSNGRDGLMAYEHNFRDIQAKKAYFLINNKLICLGNTINSLLPDSVATTVDQSFKNGDIVFYTDKEQSLTNEKFNGNLKWVHHNNIGCVFPKGGELSISKKQQKGSWYEINESYSKDLLTANIFSVWFNHGRKPQNGGYYYIIVPDISLADFRKSYKDYDIEIMSNDLHIQAIRSRKDSCYAMVFYRSGTVDMKEFSISSDSPVLLYINELDNENLEISIADPLYRQSSVNIAIGCKLSGEDTEYENGKTKLHFTMPKDDYQGSTITRIYKKL